MTLWVQQLLIIFIVAGAFWWFDSVSAYSSLIGGLLYWLPNAYFTLYAFRFKGARAAAMVLRSMYRGEVGKFTLTVVGFAIIFTWVKPLDPFALFITYSVITVSQWAFVSRWP